MINPNELNNPSQSNPLCISQRHHHEKVARGTVKPIDSPLDKPRHPTQRPHGPPIGRGADAIRPAAHGCPADRREPPRESKRDGTKRIDSASRAPKSVEEKGTHRGAVAVVPDRDDPVAGASHHPPVRLHRRRDANAAPPPLPLSASSPPQPRSASLTQHASRRECALAGGDW